MQIDLAAIGLSKEEIQNRVVESIADSLRIDSFSDDEGNICGRPKDELNRRIQQIIDTALEKHASEVLTPAIAGQMAVLEIQQTNRYGEKKGPPLTLTEYITKAADEYLREEVDSNGKSRSTKSYDSYNWKAESSRAFWLINKAVQENVHAQINTALATVNAEVAAAVSEAVKTQIQKIQNAFVQKNK